MDRHRRSVLRVGAAAGVAGLSGCLGLLSGGDDAGSGSTTTTRTGPARMRNHAVEAPADPRVGGDLALTVTVTNAGGRTGAYSDTLRLSGPQTLTRAVSVDGVEPGATASTTVTVGVDHAGTYTATLQGSGASTTFTVRPRRADLGAAVALDDALELTVEHAAVRSSLIVEGDGPRYLSGPVPGLLPVEDRAETVLLVLQGAIENTGEEARTFDPAALDLATESGPDPTFYTDLGRTTSPGVPIAGASATLGGAPLAGVDLPAGARREGWLVAPVAREAARGAITLRVQRDGAGPAESVWTFEPDGERRSLPRFEVASLSVPDRQVNATRGEFSVTVRNAGDGPGTFRGVLDISAIEPDRAPVGRVTGRVDPGRTATLTGEFRMAWYGRQSLQLQPSGEERHCEGTEMELNYGERMTMPNGVTVKVFAPTNTDLIRYANDIPGRGSDYLIVGINARLPESARGRGLGKQLLPHLNDFEINNEKDDPLPALRVAWDRAREQAQNNGNTIVVPVDGPVYPLVPPKTPSEGFVQGWAEFLNPDSWPDNKNEIILTPVLKTVEDKNYGKIIRVSWS